MLELLTDKEMSAPEIAEELDTPLTTVKYNLGELLGAAVVSGIIEVWQYHPSLRGTPSAVVEENAKQGIPVPVPMPVTKGMGIPSIDLPQMPVSHPGVWFLFGCIFKVVLLMLMKYRRKGV